MRVAVWVVIVGLGFLGAISAVTTSVRESRRLEQLTIERDIEAANSLRSFRAHEKLQQVIPPYQPAAKPLPGQRDA